MSVEDVVLFVLVALNVAVLAYFLLVNLALVTLLASAALEMRAHRLDVWRESRWRVLSSEGAHRLAARDVEPDVEGVRLAAVLLVDDDQRRRAPGAVDRAHGRRLQPPPQRRGVDIDSDTLVEADALQRMIRPFLVSDEVVAVGGTIRAVNGCEVRAGRVVKERPPRRLLPALQAVEYLRAFLAGRLGWNRLGGNLVISGAFGLFRREPMIAAGGYLHETVGEDMEVVVRMRRLGRKAGTGEHVVFVPDPVAWTEVPERARILARQRDRWHRGLADVLRRH